MYSPRRPARAAFPTVEALRRRVIAGLHAALGDAEITLAQDDPNTLCVETAASGANMVHLGNLATELVGQLPRPAAEARVEAFIAMVRSLARGGPALAADRLYPALRHRDFPARSGCDPLTRPGPGDCLAVLMSDEGAHTAMVTEAGLDAAGLDSAGAWDAAEENFARILTRLVLFAGPGGLLSLELEDYDWLGSSLLLAPAVIAHVMAAQDTGPVYLAAPSRHSVEMIPVAAPGALTTLAAWMAERLAEPHPQSDLVFRYAADARAPRPAFAFENGRLRPLS
ncbi:hypothetical protein [Tropicibacter sp. S64]|uniref:hypothetical protein n=1 Tax=Tropicibacter sp. S64 TaxID=3415122 RepID=UPI003C798CBE